MRLEAGLRMPALWVPVAAAVAVTAVLGTVAADSRWLAALGAYVTRHGSIPDYVPFASAPSHDWTNVPALAELAFHGLEALAGDRGLLIAQTLAVAVAFTLLAQAMRAERAAGSGAVVALLLTIPATLAALAEIRVQLFSLALFPALVLLLRAESQRPSRRIWLAVPLVALWSNLHGAVLVGLAVTAAYVVVERARREPVVAVAVLASSALAVCATPGLWKTPSYYAGVLGNEAARRGIGQWATVSTSGLDIAFVVCAAVLVAGALRARPRTWELVALVALALLTARAARGGVWLAFFAAPVAAPALGRGEAVRARLGVPLVAGLLGLTVFGLVRGPHQVVAGRGLLRTALARAHGTPILATDLLAEQVVLAGGRIWVGNPIDAFGHDDQRLYVDWLQGKPAGDAALAHAPRVVLVRPGTAPARRLAQTRRLRKLGSDDDAVLYVR